MNNFTFNKRARTETSLPSDLLRKGNHRLGVLALIYGTVYLITAFLIPHPTVTSGRFFSGSLVDIIGILFIVSSIAFYFVIRSRWVGPKTLHWAGFAFQVYGAIGIEFGILTWNGDSSQVTLGLSWTTVWIVSFPLFVPASPWFTLSASTLAASARPLMFLILWLEGIAMPAPAVMAQLIVPNYLCVGIAVLAARVVYGLGREVAEARRMGSYHLVEKLGDGGMGEVWVAEHEMLARPAAIKLIRSDLMMESDLLDRFQREVQATSQLRSPHTIAVYDYGVTPEGVFYYVMELLDGIDLEQLIRREGALPVPRVIHILRQVCHSLAEAHQQGMVHRDIKPANIFLCRYGRDVDFVKLLDFGLVKQTDPEPNNIELTRADAFTGTPTYASPEMARGEVDKIDGRADIYALGCVAFWLLTGSPVFEASSALDMLMKHASELPEPPSRLAEQAIPEELDQVVLECMEKGLDDRIGSAEELSMRLAAIGESNPWSPDDARRWWSLHTGDFTQTRASTDQSPEEPQPAIHHVSKWAALSTTTGSPPLPSRRKRV